MHSSPEPINRSYGMGVELRQLEAFVAVATQLHFGRAAEKLHLGQPTLSELIKKLERELGTPLFTRTTRRVGLTGAGAELLTRSKVILDDVAAATAAVRRIAEGASGRVRLGITPPVAPVLAPLLCAQFAVEAPDVAIELRRMWLPMLIRALTDAEIDVAITCGLVSEPEGIVSEVFCAEPLMVALRPSHRFTSRSSVSLAELAHDVRGAVRESLFPAWALTQRQVLEAAGIAPPSVELEETDLNATRWVEQDNVDWILITPSLVGSHRDDVIKPLQPEVLVPYTLQWNPDRAQTPAVARFVHTALTVDPPAGWSRQPGHLRHATPW
jgi:DNA-binding transcriptional LysR family regulator